MTAIVGIRLVACPPVSAANIPRVLSSAAGRVQFRGGERSEIRAGDTVTRPGEGTGPARDPHIHGPLSAVSGGSAEWAGTLPMMSTRAELAPWPPGRRP